MHDVCTLAWQEESDSSLAFVAQLLLLLLHDLGVDLGTLGWLVPVPLRRVQRVAVALLLCFVCLLLELGSNRRGNPVAATVSAAGNQLEILNARTRTRTWSPGARVRWAFRLPGERVHQSSDQGYIVHDELSAGTIILR